MDTETAVRSEKRRGNGFSARARTEPGLMGWLLPEGAPSQSCDQGRGCLLRLEDRQSQPGALVTFST